MLKHLIENDSGSKDIPQLIVMDTKQSPSNFDDVDVKGENTSTVITFSLHCPHKMQSFNSRVSGPLNYYHKKAVSEWNLNNFWEKVTIFYITAWLAEAYCNTCIFQNNINGFNKSEIYPCSSNVFCKDDFLLSFFLTNFGNRY